MNILVDITHPAHVHLFRNFIKEMKNLGHQVTVVARNKSITYKLLDAYDINHIKLGENYSTNIGKIFGLFLFTIRLLNICKKHKVQIIVETGAGLYPAVVSRLLFLKNICFNNTDVFFLLKYIKYLSNTWVTPSSYKLNLGQNHIRINSYHELAFLHPKYFEPDFSIFDRLDLERNEKFTLLRFVEWNAAEETKYKGFSIDEIRIVVAEFKKFGRVLISCEYLLPDDLISLQIENFRNVKYDDMQSIEYYSSIVFGESGAMAAEASMLGKPAFFISPKELGFIEELEKEHNLLFIYKDKGKALSHAIELLQDDVALKKWENKKKKMIKQKVIYTDFMVWFVKNYPESAKIMKKNPDYQERFKC